MRITITNTNTGKIDREISVNANQIEPAMWALAELFPQCIAKAWFPGALEPISNYCYHGKNPDHMGVNRLDIERIKARFCKSDDAKEIEEIVVEGLNSVFDDLGKFGDRDDFIVQITLAAEQWAKDCYEVGIG